MSTRINQLNKRLCAATAGILMAEAKRRAVHKTRSQTTPQNMAAAKKLIDRAVAEAAQLYPVPIRITLSRILFQNPLTAGMIERTKDDVRGYIRELIFARLPGGKLIFEADQALERGETVDFKKLETARELLYNLPVRQATGIGINQHLLGVYGFSLYQGLMDGFPRFGLVREGFRALTWPTPEQAKRNILYRVFKYNPGLKEVVEAVEQLLKKEKLGGDELSFACHARRVVLRLIVGANLAKWRLGAFHHYQAYFKNPGDVARQCFPFVNHPVFESLKEDDILSFEELKKSNLINQPFMQGILSEFERTFYAKFETGRCRREGSRLSKQDLFETLLMLVIFKDQTGKQLRRELFDLMRKITPVNESVLTLNCRMVKRYGLKIFEDLFGMSSKTYFRSKSFWGRKTSH